jgi:hypothetical protein
MIGKPATSKPVNRVHLLRKQCKEALASIVAQCLQEDMDIEDIHAQFHDVYRESLEARLVMEMLAAQHRVKAMNSKQKRATP